LLFVVRDIVKNGGPILTGKDLVHSEERVVNVKEGYPYRLAIVVFLGYLATKELRGEYGRKKSEKEHKENQVQ
jgi:hypothetical protein